MFFTAEAAELETRLKITKYHKPCRIVFIMRYQRTGVEEGKRVHIVRTISLLRHILISSII